MANSENFICFQSNDTKDLILRILYAPVCAFVEAAEQQCAFLYSFNKNEKFIHSFSSPSMIHFAYMCSF